jgi:hypothetical protein
LTALREMTVDVNVLIHGSGGSSGIQASCRAFMSAMKANPSAFLVMDLGDRIERQYNKRLANRDEGRKWVQHFLTRQRVRHVTRVAIPQGTSTRLLSLGFTGEDRENYVRTAGASACRLIVTHDPDFRFANHILKKGMEVQARGSDQARAIIEGATCPRCGD